MVTGELVVNPQRFQQGLTYHEYLSQLEKNRDKFQDYYDGCRIEPQDARRLQGLAGLPRGPRKLLVLAEDWCPDVHRGLPVFAHMAEAAGLELRVFSREQNPDIMGLFLKDGKYMAIPVAVFYTNDLQYICHWTERPQVAHREIEEAVQKAEEANPDIPTKELMSLRHSLGSQSAPHWQQAIVQEALDLLDRNASLSSRP